MKKQKPKKTVSAPVEPVFIEDDRGAPPNTAYAMDASRIRAAIECAETGQVGDLWNLYAGIIAGDSWIQGLLSTRKLAVLNDIIRAIPDDEKNPDDVEAADEMNATIKQLRSFRRSTLSHLLDAILWPVAVVEKVYRPDESRPGRFLLDRILPVQHYAEDYRNGRLQLRHQDPSSGRTLDTLYDIDAFRHIVHRGSMLTTPDNWGGPFRSLLILWLLRTCNREWWGRNTERFGSPFPVGKYPAGDRDAKAKLQSAFSNFLRLGGLVVSDQTTIELIKGADAGSTSAFQQLQSWAETQIQILILGQTLSATAESTGLGSGVANLQGMVRDDIIRFDSRILAETLDDSLARPHLELNSLSGSCHIQIGDATDIKRAAVIAGMMPGIMAAGLTPTDSGVENLSRILGVELRRGSSTLPLSSERLAILTQALRGARSPSESRSVLGGHLGF